MERSILNGKSILAVDDEPDVLAVLEEEIRHACPDCRIGKATSYEQAVDAMDRNTYDIAVLDIMGVRGFDLLEMAVGRGIRAVMLTANVLTPEALKESHDLGARAFLPKEKLGNIVHFLEDVLAHDHKSGWERLIRKLEDYYDQRFGNDWRKKFPYYY